MVCVAAAGGAAVGVVVAAAGELGLAEEEEASVVLFPVSAEDDAAVDVLATLEFSTAVVGVV